jgi:hypothetical protein
MHLATVVKTATYGQHQTMGAPQTHAKTTSMSRQHGLIRAIPKTQERVNWHNNKLFLLRNTTCFIQLRFALIASVLSLRHRVSIVVK